MFVCLFVCLLVRLLVCVCVCVCVRVLVCLHLAALDGRSAVGGGLMEFAGVDKAARSKSARYGKGGHCGN